MTTRRLSAVLVADVVGFSAQMERDDAGTLARLRTMRNEIVDPAIDVNGGRIVKTTGDGLLVEFGSADASLRCAVAIQHALAGRNASLPPDDRLDLRIGINLGDVIAEGDDIFGDGVNVAARLESLAPPGGICVSHAVREQVHGTLDIEFEDAGERQVKNIARAIRCYYVGLAPDTRRPVGQPNQTLPAMSVGILPFAIGSEQAGLRRRAKSIARDFTAMLARCSAMLSVKHAVAQGAAGVRYLVEGEVDVAADATVVDVHLVDATSSEQLWSEAVSLPHADDAGKNAQHLHAVAWRLSRALAGVEVRRVTAHPETASTPVDFVLQAIGLDRTEADVAQRMPKKEALLEEALRRDPNCVPALLGIAVAMDLRLSRDLDADRLSVVRRMDEVTTKALRLNDTQPVAWLMRSAALMYSGQWQAALEASAKSIALEPYSSDLLGHRAWLILLCGRPEESLRRLEEAAAMDPRRSPPQMQVACEAHLLMGDYVQAIAAGERSLGLGAVDDFETHVRLAAAYANAGDAAKADAAKEVVLRLAPRYTLAIHRARTYSRHPDYLALLDQHLYPGARIAGLPER